MIAVLYTSVCTCVWNIYKSASTCVIFTATTLVPMKIEICTGYMNKYGFKIDFLIGL